MIVDLNTGGSRVLSPLHPDRVLQEPEDHRTRRRVRRGMTGDGHYEHRGAAYKQIPLDSLLSKAQTLALVAGSRDPYTSCHQRRVAHLAAAIAQEMGLPRHLVEEVYIAGLVHDIGKISLPPEILSKPGRLTDEQMAIVKTHPLSGYQSLTRLGFPASVAEVVLQHHERLDGSGYPQGLSSGDIPVPARVVAVADVLEAATSDRPYRPARSMKQILDVVLEDQGVLYDREAVLAFRELVTLKGYDLGSEQSELGGNGLLTKPPAT
jgi:putative nucleotidyltransferase with HDIG domain